jgi:NAD/NADP transhydrogenase beta subunit
MSQSASGTRVRPGKPTPNVYTVLVIVATLVLGGGVGYLAMKNLQITQIPESQGGQGSDGSNPLFIIEQ